jgi:hypothetical protein
MPTIQRRKETEDMAGPVEKARPYLPSLAAALLGLSVLGGCSGGKEAREVDKMLTRAATAVDVANSEETRRYAAPELETAADRLGRARWAAREKDYEEADRYISETFVNVNLATAKAEAARIREQIQRMKGPSAPAKGDR